MQLLNSWSEFFITSHVESLFIKDTASLELNRTIDETICKGFSWSGKTQLSSMLNFWMYFDELHNALLWSTLQGGVNGVLISYINIAFLCVIRTRNNFQTVGSHVDRPKKSQHCHVSFLTSKNIENSYFKLIACWAKNITSHIQRVVAKVWDDVPAKSQPLCLQMLPLFLKMVAVVFINGDWAFWCIIK